MRETVAHDSNRYKEDLTSIARSVPGDIKMESSPQYAREKQCDDFGPSSTTDPIQLRADVSTICYTDEQTL